MSMIKSGSESGCASQVVKTMINPNFVPGLNIVKTKNAIMEGAYSTGVKGQTDDPVDIDTVYDLASISKLYTAALVLRQVQKGSISLDEDFNKYLDGQSFKQSSLTIRDLLSHRVDFRLRLEKYRKESPNDFKNALLRIRVPREPSDKVIYHNLNYIYLGYILENVVECSLENQMESLFTDLGLLDTYTGNSIIDKGIECPATEVLDDGSIVVNITHDESARFHGGLAGNAGVFATARDLAKFGQAWLRGQVINQALLKEALRNYDKAGNRPQGLGWQMCFKNGTKLPKGTYGHSGFTGCYLAINTNTSEVTAITMNRTFFGRDNTNDQAIWEAVLHAST